MIRLPEEYQNNIIKMFGEIGKNWLDRIPKLFEEYISKFQLTNVKLIEPLTYNVLAFAESKEYGNIIVKIEIPFKEMTIRESVALKINNGAGACKCYYANVEDGIILLERLFPGTNLNSIKDLDERISIFKEVSEKFNVEVLEKVELPTYGEILNRSVNMAQEQEEKFSPIRELLDLAENLYKDLHENNASNYLLHSDLYSDNILITENGWKAIDPHGFIGERVLDTAIYLQKELEKGNFDEKEIELLLCKISEKCGFSVAELCQALYINYVLNICWDIEVNLGESHMKTCIQRARLILKILENFTNEKTNQNKENASKIKKLLLEGNDD